MQKKIILVLCALLMFTSCLSTSTETENIDTTSAIQETDFLPNDVLQQEDELTQTTTPSNNSFENDDVSIQFNVDSEFPTEEVVELTTVELYQQYIDGCVLEVVSSPKQITKNRSFASAFSVKCLKDGNPISNMLVTVRYPVAQVNGEIAFGKTIIETSEAGIASFMPEHTNFSCNSNVYFYLTPETEDPETEKYAENNAVSIPYKVITNRFYDSGILAIADYNASNRALSTNTTATSLQPPLRKAGFQTIGNAPFDASVITSKNLYSQAKEIFGNSVSFMIYGTVKYAEPAIKLEDGKYSVTLVTNFSVMNLKDGSIAYKEEFFTTEQASSEWEAANTLRTKTIPQIITEKVIYGI